MDCLEYMKTIPDKYFDLCIADPPYGINVANMANTKSARNRLQQGAGKLKNRILQTNKKDWDFFPPTKEIFNEIFRVSKAQIIWGGNYFDLPPTRGIICWDKVQPWGNFSQIEMAWTSFDYPAKLFRFDNRTQDKIHPTQKPVALLEHLIRIFTDENDVVIDPCAGSGSTLLAAKNVGRRAYGFEIKKDFYKKAIGLIENYSSPVLF